MICSQHHTAGLQANMPSMHEATSDQPATQPATNVQKRSVNGIMLRI